MLIIIKLPFDFYRKGADKLIQNVIKRSQNTFATFKIRLIIKILRLCDKIIKLNLMIKKRVNFRKFACSQNETFQ